MGVLHIDCKETRSRLPTAPHTQGRAASSGSPQFFAIQLRVIKTPSEQHCCVQTCSGRHCG